MRCERCTTTVQYTLEFPINVCDACYRLCEITIDRGVCSCCFEVFPYRRGGFGFIFQTEANYEGTSFCEEFLTRWIPKCRSTSLDERRRSLKTSWIVCPRCAELECYGAQNYRLAILNSEDENPRTFEGLKIPQLLKPNPRIKRQCGFGVGINRKQALVSISRKLFTIDQFKKEKRVKSNQDAFMFREVSQVVLIQADTIEFLKKQKREEKSMKYTFRQILWIFQEGREGPFVYS